jgi:hypothetical protein
LRLYSNVGGCNADKEQIFTVQTTEVVVAIANSVFVIVQLVLYARPRGDEKFVILNTLPLASFVCSARECPSRQSQFIRRVRCNSISLFPHVKNKRSGITVLLIPF